jgi:hypothetical protein
MSEQDGGSIKGELAVDAVTGSLAAKGEVTQVDRVMRLLRPEVYREQEIFDTVVVEIRRKLAAKEPLSALESLVITANLQNVLRKTKNISNVITYALEEAPDLAKITGGASMPKLIDQAEREAKDAGEHTQCAATEYFWERFWADAEAISVEDVQRLYGRILGRASLGKHRISLRTLDAIRCLDPLTQQIFERVAPFVINKQWLPSFEQFRRAFDRAGIEIGHIVELEDANFIGSNTMSMRFLHVGVGGYVIKPSNETLKHNVPGRTLSRPARDLFGFLAPKVEEWHARAVASYLEGWTSGGVVWRPDGKTDFEPLPRVDEDFFPVAEEPDA